MSDRTSKLRVAMLAFELAPYSSDGELSEVVAGLGEALADQGMEIKVFSPLHRSVTQLSDVRRLMRLRSVPLGDAEFEIDLHCDQSRAASDRLFIGNEELFDREAIYSSDAALTDHPDNFERFYVFSLAVLEALRKMDWKPDILHCHEAHTSLLPAYLKLRCMGRPFFNHISSLLTIHNLRYQGQFGAGKFDLTGFPGELFYPLGPFEYYGELNSLKAGICYADLVNTVSPRYAREIQTEQYGCGLEEVLQQRSDHLSGILNGIDPRNWDPENDREIAAPFSARELTGKGGNSRQVRRLSGLPAREVPLVILIVREPRQNGLDLFLDAFPELSQIDCQWLVLDQRHGDPGGCLPRLREERPNRFGLIQKPDTATMRQALAGADMILMPSRLEPCGLNQMRAMRYGTVPVVRHCGGLIDTVAPFGPEERMPTGFRFYRYEVEEMLSTVRSAVELWRRDRESWAHLVRNAMAKDFSWGPRAREYCELYEKIRDV